MDIITSVVSDDLTLPFDGPRGFSSAGLVGLYFMDGADTPASIANAANGNLPTAVVPAGAPSSAWSSGTLMANGGINLKGNTILPGPAIDLTKAWTMFAHAAVGLPVQHSSVTTWVSPILSTDQYVNAKGVIAYATIGTAYPTSVTQLNPLLRWFNSGAQAPAVNVGAPSDLTYEDVVTFAISFNAGTLRCRIMRNGIKIAETAQAVVIANIVNSVPNQKPTVSTNLQNFPEANILCEVFGVYTRELTDNDLATTDLVSIAVRQARGR